MELSDSIINKINYTSNILDIKSRLLQDIISHVGEELILSILLDHRIDLLRDVVCSEAIEPWRSK